MVRLEPAGSVNICGERLPVHARGSHCVRQRAGGSGRHLACDADSTPLTISVSFAPTMIRLSGTSFAASPIGTTGPEGGASISLGFMPMSVSARRTRLTVSVAGPGTFNPNSNGADGLDRSLVSGAAQALSFGPQTWPHALARAMLAEQIYRAATILAGKPYHRD